MNHPEEPALGEEPILVELSTLGIETRSLAELRHSGKNYRNAVPVLVEWLSRVTDRKLKEEIVRTLSVPWAKPLATKPMIDEFRQLRESEDPSGLGLRWAMGNALNVIADDAFFEDLVALATEPRFGRAREMIVLGLGKSKRPEAAEVLLNLVDDPDVDGHAIQALGKLKVQRARVAFERKTNDKRAWVRNEAKRALARLDAQVSKNTT